MISTIKLKTKQNNKKQSEQELLIAGFFPNHLHKECRKEKESEIRPGLRKELEQHLLSLCMTSSANRPETNATDTRLVPGSGAAVPVRSQPEQLTQASQVGCSPGGHQETWHC